MEILSVTSSFYCLCQTFYTLHFYVFCASYSLLDNKPLNRVGTEKERVFRTPAGFSCPRLVNKNSEYLWCSWLRAETHEDSELWPRIVFLNWSQMFIILKGLFFCSQCVVCHMSVQHNSSCSQGSCHNVVTKYSQHHVTLCLCLHNGVNTNVKTKTFELFTGKKSTPCRPVVQHHFTSVRNRTR